MLNPRRFGGALVRVVVLLALIGALVGGGYAAHKYRRASSARKSLAAGREAHAAGRFTTAAVELGRYLSLHPRDKEVLLLYADAQIRRRPQSGGNFQQAVRALENVLREDPTHRKAAEQLHDLYSMAGARTEAERVARTWLNAAVGDPEARHEARRRLAGTLITHQRWDEAGALIEEWLKEAPDHAAPLKAKASLLIARQQFEEAIPPLQLALERAPGDVDVATRLAILLVSYKKDRAAAEQLVADLVARNPQSAEAMIARGRLYLYLLVSNTGPDQQDRARTIESFEAAEKLAGEDVPTLVQLADLFAQIGLPDRSAGLLERARKAAPTEPMTYHLEAQLAIESDGTEADGAVADRLMAAPLGDGRADLLPAAVELYARAGQLQQAEKVLEELRTGGAPPETLLYGESVIALAKERLPDAVAKLQEIIRRQPQNARAHLLLGRALVELGDLRRAGSALTQAADLLQQAGRSAVATQAQLELAQLHARQQRWQDAFEAVRRIDLRQPDPRLVTKVYLIRLEIEVNVAGNTSGKPDVARLRALGETLDRLIDENPQMTSLKMLKARILAWQGEREQAVQILNALKADPQNRQGAGLVLVDVYEAAGERDRALAELNELKSSAGPDLRVQIAARMAELHASAGDAPAAQKALEETAAGLSGRDRSRALVQEARLLYRQERAEEARARLIEAIKSDVHHLQPRLMLLEIQPADARDPTRQELVDQLKAIEGERGLNYHYWQARTWLESTDAQTFKTHRAEAERLLNECLTEDPRWLGAVVALGSLHEKAGEPEAALEVYRRYLSLKPDEIPVAVRLLNLATRMRRWTEVERLLDSLPDDPALRPFRLGQALRKGERDEAIRILEEQAQSNPDDFRPLVDLGMLNLQQQEIATAERQLAEAARLAPDAPEVISARVQLHLARKGYEPALRLCDQALARSRTADLLALRSRIYEASGDLPKAIADLKAMADIEGKVEQSALALGRLYFRRNQLPEAIAAWREGLAKMPDSYLLRGALAGALLWSQDPSHQEEGRRILDAMLAQPELARDRMLLLMKADHLARVRPAEAERTYEEVIRLYPDATEAYIGLVRSAVRARRWDRALSMIQRGLEADPANVDLLLLKTEALLATKNPQQAVLSARQAAEREPNQLRTSIALVRACIQAGNHAAADTVLKQMADSAPADVTARLRIRWHAAQSQWEPLTALVRSHLEKHPDDIQTGLQAANELIGSNQPARQEQAVQLLQGLIESHPKAIEPRILLGNACYTLGRFAEVRRIYEEVLRIDPRNFKVMNDLAWILCENLKDPSAAIEWAERAIAAEPQNPHFLDTLGVIQYRLGSYAESREALTRCIDLEGTPPPTRASATFHLARTIAENDGDRARDLLEQLLGDPETKWRLSEASRAEAQALLDRLKEPDQPGPAANSADHS